MIIGTAGHIDHGKTALVRALTGVDTDRLPEEKKRGITIELGFAPMSIPGVGTVGMVDVPGHEAFVRTMVAGAAGIDLALIVVAADEGVMPQTREHIAIIDLLGVNRAVIAITKSDLADATRLHVVERDVMQLLAPTSVAGAPCVAVSVITGFGLDELRQRLATSVRELKARADDDLTRLPIDRVFAKAGAGTVVTGTLWSGRIAVGMSVRVLPKGLRGRVRGVQTHGASVESAGPANRVAVALAGISKDDVQRGDVVVADDAWEPTSVFRADVSLLPDAKALSPRTRVRVHLGTAEVGGRIVAAGGAVQAGVRTPVRVVLDAPLVARGLDRFVLRRGDDGTIGGGILTDAMPTRRRTRPFPRARMSDAERLEHALNEAGSAGIAIDTLAFRFGGRRDAWDVVLANSKTAVAVDGLLVAGSQIEAAESRVLAWMDAERKRKPADAGVALDGVRAAARAPDGVTAWILRDLAARGAIEVTGSIARRREWAVSPDPDRDVLDELVRRLDAAGAAAPATSEIEAALRRPVLRLLRRLEREGKTVALATDRFSTIGTAQRLRETVMAQVQANKGYRPSELKSIFGVSRQYLIPWLEFFDRMGWSHRIGDQRRFVMQRTPPAGVGVRNP